MMDTPDDLLYSPGHLWVRIEGNRATLGITDYAQMSLGMILFIELPELNSFIHADEIFGSIEHIEETEDLISPLSGKITAVHSALEKKPAILNTSPYHQGWIIVIEMSQPEQVKLLWDARKYMEHYDINKF
ncbi:glycine cleavage system protein GcvH [Paenibacillus sp. GP183]|jgi:glycine cleavage system H protein|uniref:glycine cleavage system protein H n=1 Tax=Paenibacillus sp. GP183 TaxID=1882751 RepID=UPI000894F8C1|nr:glycine cleavage system protein GcvH [Paenibacillus sp. GP183]SEC53847.1 glycine cleavage system H protein [Paenibacillus sp. GP183]